MINETIIEAWKGFHFNKVKVTPSIMAINRSTTRRARNPKINSKNCAEGPEMLKGDVWVIENVNCARSGIYAYTGI